LENDFSCFVALLLCCFVALLLCCFEALWLKGEINYAGAASDVVDYFNQGVKMMRMTLLYMMLFVQNIRIVFNA